MDKPWDEDRYAPDAPVWYRMEEASAWAAGYNAAIAKFKESLDMIEIPEPLLRRAEVARKVSKQRIQGVATSLGVLPEKQSRKEEREHLVRQRALELAQADGRADPSAADLIMAEIQLNKENCWSGDCALIHCKKPAEVVRSFTIDGEERWLKICVDCEDGLLWSSNGYIETIKEICDGYNIKTGEKFNTSHDA